MPPSDGIVRVTLEFDLKTNKLLMKTGGAPTVVVQGVVQEALSQITQNQVRQKNAQAQLLMASKLAELEKKIGELTRLVAASALPPSAPSPMLAVPAAPEAPAAPDASTSSEPEEPAA